MYGGHFPTSSSLSTAYLEGLILIALSVGGCSATPQDALTQTPRQDTQRHQAELKQLKSTITRRLELANPVHLARSDLLRCAPPTDVKDSPIQLTLILNPQGIEDDHATSATHNSNLLSALNRWAAWLQTRRVTFAIEVSADEEVNTAQLEQRRAQLERLLRRAGWPLGQPPLRAWYRASHGSLPHDAQEHKSSSVGAPKLSLLEGGWLPLHQLTPRAQVRWIKVARRETSRHETPRHSSETCDQLTQALSQLSSVTTRASAPSIADLIEESSGLRLIKAPRPAISSACARLFSFSDDDVKSERAESGEELPRWHLVLRRLERATGAQESGAREESVTHAEYLTLPVPLDPLDTPLDAHSTPLKTLWARRDLWWGAQGCWQRVDGASLHSPISQTTRRWYNLNAQAPQIGSARPLEISQWRAPRSDLSLSSPQFALERESSYQVGLNARGVVSSLLGPQQMIPQWSTAPLLAALWSRGRARAFLLASVAPLAPHEALAQLSGDHAVSRVAFETYISLGPVLYLPHDGETPPPHWLAHAQPLLKAVNSAHQRAESHQEDRPQGESHRAHQLLRDGDLITMGGSTVDARWLLGEPSMTSATERALLKERLARFLSVITPLPERRRLNPGETIIHRGGPWLGVQRHRVTAPPNLLP